MGAKILEFEQCKKMLKYGCLSKGEYRSLLVSVVLFYANIAAFTYAMCSYIQNWIADVGIAMIIGSLSFYHMRKTYHILKHRRVTKEIDYLSNYSVSSIIVIAIVGISLLTTNWPTLVVELIGCLLTISFAFNILLTMKLDKKH